MDSASSTYPLDPRVARLRAIWQLRRIDLGMTQVDVAKALGSTQASVSQLLAGKLPLSEDVILGFAQLLRVFPENIDPSLDDVIATHTETVTRDASGRPIHPPYTRQVLGPLEWIDVDALLSMDQAS